MACRDKTRYPSRAKARAALDSIRSRGYREGVTTRPVRAYACPHCGGWHLTSNPE